MVTDLKLIHVLYSITQDQFKIIQLDAALRAEILYRVSALHAFTPSIIIVV